MKKVKEHLIQFWWNKRTRQDWEGQASFVKEYPRPSDWIPHIKHSGETVRHLLSGPRGQKTSQTQGEERADTLTVAWEMVRIPFLTEHFLLCHTFRILRMEPNTAWYSTCFTSCTVSCLAIITKSPQPNTTQARIWAAFNDPSWRGTQTSRHTQRGTTAVGFFPLWPHSRHVEPPWAGTEPVSPAVEAQSLNHWAAREALSTVGCENGRQQKSDSRINKWLQSHSYYRVSCRHLKIITQLHMCWPTQISEAHGWLKKQAVLRYFGYHLEKLRF